jgi:hypothetical protein
LAFDDIQNQTEGIFMTGPIVSAIFHDHQSAERAVTSLRNAGIDDRAIAIVSRRPREDVAGSQTDDHSDPDNKGSGALKGLGAGAGVGALFGLGALIIPGVGPFIAAGSLVETLGVAGSAAASGAIVAGTAGGIAGALMNYGVSEEDAAHYEERIRQGGIWIAVDTRRTAADARTVADLMRRADGTAVHAARSASFA